jgi:photosystem II stability/assembly factor-like uncharacterized protein
LNGYCVHVLIRKLLDSASRFSLIAGLALFVLLHSFSAFPALATESQMMPLAHQSLLLDGQLIGDRIIVVGERGHILVSEDDGRSWQQQPVPTRATLTSVFFVDPANGWAAGHDSLILQTSDGGRHWQEVYSDPEDERPILDLWFKDAIHGYAIGAYGLFLATHDGGRSWDPVDFNPATLILDNVDCDTPWGQEEEEVWVDFHLNQITATRNGRILIAAEAGNIYRSDDGCRSWISLPSPYEGSFYGSLPLGQGKVLLFGLRGHLFFSENTGNSWAPVISNTQATLNDGIQLRDGRVVVAGLAGTLLISEDQGRSFELHAQADRAGIAKVLQARDGALVLIGEMGVKRIELPGPGGEVEP